MQAGCLDIQEKDFPEARCIQGWCLSSGLSASDFRVTFRAAALILHPA